MLLSLYYVHINLLGGLAKLNAKVQSINIKANGKKANGILKDG